MYCVCSPGLMMYWSTSFCIAFRNIFWFPCFCVVNSCNSVSSVFLKTYSHVVSLFLHRVDEVCDLYDLVSIFLLWVFMCRFLIHTLFFSRRWSVCGLHKVWLHAIVWWTWACHSLWWSHPCQVRHVCADFGPVTSFRGPEYAIPRDDATLTNYHKWFDYVMALPQVHMITTAHTHFEYPHTFACACM